MNHKEFLLSEFWVLSWGASVQRAGLFKSDINPTMRANFRTDVIGYVTDQLIPLYKRPVTEQKHLQNIEKLSGHGSRLWDVQSSARTDTESGLPRNSSICI